MSSLSQSAQIKIRNWERQRGWDDNIASDKHISVNSTGNTTIIDDNGNSMELDKQKSIKLEAANMLSECYQSMLNLLDLIKKLQEQLGNNSDIILRENCHALTYFLMCIERILLFGFKRKYFKNSSLWTFFMSSAIKSYHKCDKLENDIELIKSIETLNDIGKSRAFLRQALRSKMLHRYIRYNNIRCF